MSSPEEPTGALARRAETKPPYDGVSPMSSALRSLAIGLVAVISVACTAAGASPSPASSDGADPSSSPRASGIAHADGKTDLVLRLRYVGGFAPQSARFLDIPAISVYGDGTVIVPGPQILIYPGPALPNLQQATITPAGMQTLLEAAREAGLFGPDAHYDLGGIMDASSAEFILVAEGRTHTISAYALMEGGGTPPDSDPAVVEARTKLARFQEQLGYLKGLLGADLGTWSAYDAEALQLLVTPGAPVNDQGLVQEPIAWPLATPLVAFGTSLTDLMEGQRCGVVGGADVQTLLPLLQEANWLTPWTSEDAAFGIAVRPLLPGEEGCIPTR